MTQIKLALYKIKYSSAFGEMWYVTNAENANDAKLAFYFHITYASNIIEDARKTTYKFVKGAHFHYNNYYSFPALKK